MFKPDTLAPPTCKRGHALTPENLYRNNAGHSCRRCRTELQQKRRAEARAKLAELIRAGNEERAEPQEAVVLSFEERRIATREGWFDAKVAELKARADISPGFRAWIERKTREAWDLPLRRCDREQITEQLEDLGTL